MAAKRPKARWVGRKEKADESSTVSWDKCVCGSAAALGTESELGFGRKEQADENSTGS